jgi:hypothetical protein
MRLPSEKYKIVSWKKKDFKDHDDLLVSSDFILQLLKKLMYLYHVLFAMINIYIYGIDC